MHRRTQNVLNHLSIKSTLYTLNTHPRSPNLIPFRSMVARFQISEVFGSPWGDNGEFQTIVKNQKLRISKNKQNSSFVGTTEKKIQKKLETIKKWVERVPAPIGAYVKEDEKNSKNSENDFQKQNNINKKKSQSMSPRTKTTKIKKVHAIPSEIIDATDGRTSISFLFLDHDEFLFHELCWHNQADLKIYKQV